MQRLGFHVICPVKGTRLALLRELRAKGLVPRFVGSGECVLQIAPFSKLNWKRNLDGTLVVSAFFAHKGLTHKTRLFELLVQDERTASFTCKFRIFQAGELTLERLQAVLEADRSSAWVLKGNTSNNASRVFFLASVKDLHWVSECVNEQESWLLQEMVKRPLLYKGRKFHVRANVVAIGNLRIYVHNEPVLHVACEEYKESHFENRFIHVTNHVLQAQHEKYDAKANQISLWELEQFLDDQAEKTKTNARQRIFTALKHAIRSAFIAVLEKGTMADFMPKTDCFELFGFDFIISDDDFEVKLLEVNHGPALEGHESMDQEELCSRIVRDVLALVVLPILGEDQHHEESNGFAQVYSANGEQFLSSHFLSFMTEICARAPIETAQVPETLQNEQAGTV